MKALRLEPRQIEDILTGTAVSLIRPATTSELNRIIALIETESGLVRGWCKIVAVNLLLTAEDIGRQTQPSVLAQVRPTEDSEARPRSYTWRIAEARWLVPPVAYRPQPSNAAATWIDLPPAISQRIKASLARSSEIFAGTSAT
jgi:hypothetical protein